MLSFIGVIDLLINNSIIDISRVSQFHQYVGTKTIGLSELKNLGLSVPGFVAIPCNYVSTLWTKEIINQAKLNELVENTLQTLPCSKYIVRSSALSEDGGIFSNAGQFHSVTDVRPEQLATAITEVLAQAKEKCGGSLEQLSLIIQEYISAEFSGVTFTRNPLASRSMLIEWVEGPSHPLVAGEQQPEQLEVYHDQTAASKKSSRFDPIIETFKRIEEYFACPQDIEWCFAKNTWWFLQSRPITTISKNEYNAMLYLDKALPKGGNFYFEKTSLCETASRPCLVTYQMLKRIYSKNGPVQQVYKKYGIQYQSQDFLKIIGNELYSDRNLEIKTLLPAYTYDEKQKPKLATISPQMLWRTVTNLLALRKIKKNRLQELFPNIRQALSTKLDSNCSIEKVESEFLRDYSLIFEINLHADIHVKHLELALKSLSSKLTLPAVGNFLIGEIKTEYYLEPPPDNLLGNSLDLLDNNPFFTPTITQNKKICLLDSLSMLAEWRRKYLSELIETAQIATRFREYGRWLTVKHINRLKTLLSAETSRLKLIENNHVYFLFLDEIANGKNLAELAKTRYENWNEMNKLSLPAQIKSNFDSYLSKKPLGVSPGCATGKLMQEHQLSLEQQDNPCILYVTMLLPQLVKYFDRIQGIVSEQGGMLSHLAIVAREHHIPIVTNVNLRQTSCSIGDVVTIDGDIGKISLHR